MNATRNKKEGDTKEKTKQEGKKKDEPWEQLARRENEEECSFSLVFTLSSSTLLGLIGVIELIGLIGSIAVFGLLRLIGSVGLTRLFALTLLLNT